MILPRAGDVVHLTRAASVQFIKPIFVRVIRVLDWPTYDHWVWLEGYSLDDRGDAVERRTLFVRRAGLRICRQSPPRLHPQLMCTPSARRPSGR